MIYFIGKILSVSLFLAAFFVGCGGENESRLTTESLDGEWKSGCFKDPSNNLYYYRDLVNFKTTANEVNFSGNLSSYDSPQCVEPALASSDYEGLFKPFETIELNGETKFRGALIDKEKNTEKFSVILQETIFMIGNPEANLDPEGYPTTLKAQSYFRTK